MDIQR